MPLCLAAQILRKGVGESLLCHHGIRLFSQLKHRGIDGGEEGITPYIHPDMGDIKLSRKVNGLLVDLTPANDKDLVFRLQPRGGFR